MAEHNVVFTTLDAETPWSLETYLAIDGYAAWKKILAEKTDPADIIVRSKPLAIDRTAAKTSTTAATPITATVDDATRCGRVRRFSHGTAMI